MQWPGTYELLRQYQHELYDAAERDRLANEAAMARSAKRRMAWQRLVAGVLGSGGR
jgi:hypothetical protein